MEDSTHTLLLCIFRYIPDQRMPRKISLEYIESACCCLKNDKTCKLGIKSKRAKSGYDRNYMFTLLGFDARTHKSSKRKISCDNPEKTGICCRATRASERCQNIKLPQP
jgi:hypothetical protein